VDPDRIRRTGGAVISVTGEGEFALIRRITARLRAGADVLLGPGDDAAVVAAPDGRVVATTDLMVAGRHFRLDWSTPYDVGRKAAAANLADVVAMGARPTALLVGLVAPADLPAEWLDGLADGLREECDLLGASVAGGDLVRGETVTVAVTALGDLQGRAAVLRSGARPGDDVVLLGSPGRAAAGLALLEAGRSDHPLAAAHRRPQPEYRHALAIAPAATAMIDVSDGLAADLGHIAVASGVGIELTAAALPADPQVLAAADELGIEAFEWVAGGGDDHCFAVTVPAGTPTSGVRIGVTAALAAGQSPGVWFTDRDRPVLGGHDHFRA
jgi:thiamine-monophosphate kinase